MLALGELLGEQYPTCYAALNVGTDGLYNLSKYGHISNQTTYNPKATIFNTT